MDEIGQTKLDIFKPKNVLKLIACAIFVSFVLYEMIHGFMFSDLVTGVNALRQAEIVQDMKISRFELLENGNAKSILISGKNISKKNYWTLVVFIDLLDSERKKIKRIRLGTENIPSEADFNIIEEIEVSGVEEIRIVKLEGIIR